MWKGACLQHIDVQEGRKEGRWKLRHVNLVAVVPLQDAVQGTPRVAKHLPIDDAHALVGPAERSKVVPEKWLQDDDVVVQSGDQLATAPQISEINASVKPVVSNAVQMWATRSDH